MVIREMSREECELVLARTRLARLGCAQGNQPYVVPVSLVYHQPENGGACFYGVTIPGQKVEWMRTNPLVCVEVDEVAADDRWLSVIVFGRYEELPETTIAVSERPGGQESHLHFPERSDLSQVPEATPKPQALCGIVAPKPVEVQKVDDVIPETIDGHDERLQAFRLLSTQATWWERGWATWVARPNHDPEAYRIVYYKIRIDRVTGHEATPVAKKGTC
jgi:nitroimidazol reductase NimA-like FMN-containing flavoprotein (pyridoxamine 5'-phosphate oxidase superfamily)